MAHIQIITYDEYKAGANLMNATDKSLFDSAYFKNPLELNDTEQMIASLKCITPSEADLDQYETIAKEKNVTGMAYDLRSK